MRTRQRHNLSIDTIETLTTAKNGATWRAFAETLGYDASYAATLNKAARGLPGAMTPAAENTLRARLGLAPLRAVIPVSPCEDCAGNGIAAVHTGRCYGKPVAQVVVLTSGERVTSDPVAPPAKPRQRRPSAAIGGLRVETRAAHAARRRAAGLTWDAYLGKLLTEQEVNT